MVYRTADDAPQPTAADDGPTAPAAQLPSDPLEQQAMVLALVRQGLLPVVACERLGIEWGAHKGWLSSNHAYATGIMENEEYIREKLAAATLDAAARYSDPRRATAEVRAIQWWLERTDPEAWGRAQKVEDAATDLTAILREAVARIPRPGAPPAAPMLDITPQAVEPLGDDVLQMLN